MKIRKDGYEQPYVEWSQAKDRYERAWVRHRTGDKDWAGTGRYLNVVRCGSPGQPGGNPTDFPIYNDLPDEQILLSFVYAANAITGWNEDKPVWNPQAAAAGDARGFSHPPERPDHGSRDACFVGQVGGDQPARNRTGPGQDVRRA